MTFYIGQLKFDFTSRMSQFLLTIIQLALTVTVTVVAYDYNLTEFGSLLIGLGVLMIAGTVRRAVGGRE